MTTSGHPYATQLAVYLDEIARLFGEIDKRGATIREPRDEITRVKV